MPSCAQITSVPAGGPTTPKDSKSGGRHPANNVQRPKRRIDLCTGLVWAELGIDP